MKHVLVVIVVAGCASRPAAVREPIAAPCVAAEHRQLDFWVGDWDVTVHARATPTATQWNDSHGTQHVRAIVGGCAIEESFASAVPNQFAGKSLSSYVPALGKWRQTWVDDSGGYLAFTGGTEAGGIALYGEPRTSADGKPFQMRMTFSQITPTSLHWEWQRSEDAWATHAILMAIEYTRVRGS